MTEAPTLREVALALENSRHAQIEQGRAAEAAGDGDVDTNGDLIELPPLRYTITGWRTRDEEEAGEVLTTDIPSTAGVIVSNLLRRGYYQIIVGDQKGGS